MLEYGLLGHSKQTASSSSSFTVDSYVLLCVTKSVKTLRSIRALIDKDIGADGLALTRHIYENYLHSIFALNRPDMLVHLIDAVIGLKMGSHEYASTNTGKIDSRRIIRKSDGKVFIGQISSYKMAESSNHPDDCALFNYLYSFLSDYTHPSFTSFKLVVSGKGNLNPLSNELQNEAVFFSTCFSAMLLDELRKLNSISSEIKRDIKTITRRISVKANLILVSIYHSNELPEHYKILRSRLADLGH